MPDAVRVVHVSVALHPIAVMLCCVYCTPIEKGGLAGLVKLTLVTKAYSVRLQKYEDPSPTTRIHIKKLVMIKYL